MSTFLPLADIEPLTLARSSDINALKTAVSTAFALLPNETDLKTGKANYASTSTGTTNNYSITLSDATLGYIEGMQVVFKPIASNTGASTINVNSKGAIAIKLMTGENIAENDLASNAPAELRYSGGFFYVSANSTNKANIATTQAGIATTKAGEASDSAATALAKSDIATTKANEAAEQADIATAAAITAVQLSTATGLQTSGAAVMVNTAAPPTADQVLKATSPTTAIWQTLTPSTASAISFVPTGTIAAITVQDAIAELGTEKQDTITGGATTIATSNLTASKALTSDASGKVAASTTTSTELGYLSGVTSAIQTQIGTKQATLVSGTNISSINGTSLLLGGNLTVTSSGLNSGGTTNINGLFYGNGANVSVATAGTHYPGFATSNTFTAEQTIKGVRISNGAGNQANNIVIGEGGGGLNANTTGNYNYCIGYSMVNCTTGSNNYAFGRGALDALVSYSNCVGIGWDAAVGGSNQMRLGNTSVTVYTQSGTVSASDERDKTDIRDTVLGLDFINSLRPVDYKWDIRLDYAPKMPETIAIPDDVTDEEKAAIELENKTACESWLEAVKPVNLKHDGTHKRNRYHHGVIAQEVGALIAATGADFGGWQNFEVNGGEALQAVVYEELIAPLIKAVQELSARVVELENAR